MSKSKPNHDLWKMFAYIAEGLNNLTFIMPVETNGTPSLLHTGLAPEDMNVTISNHEYLPMTRIRIDFNLPVELTEYLESDDPDMPYSAKQLKEWLGDREHLEYLVYNVMIESILEQLRELNKLSKEVDSFSNDRNVKELIGFIATLSMEQVNSEERKHRNKYYPMVINRIPNITVYEPSDEWIDEHFGDMTAHDVQHVDTVVNRNAKRIATQLGKIGELVNQWGEKTPTVKTHDLWFSLNIEDHKIKLGLDLQPVRNEENFVINRTPVNLDQWEHEQDREMIAALESHVDEMNIVIGNLLNYNTGYEVLNKEIHQLYIGKIHHPIAKHTVRVWGFDDVCEEGRKLIDEEISWFLQTIEDECVRTQRPVKLDISNMMLHTVEQGESFILPHDEQVIAERCQTFSGTFFDAFQQHLYDVETEHFAPYTNVKPADLDNQAVITEEDLLNAPTIH
ncbi:hypothetical protein FDJ25_gp182 [Vibrio phage Aphrodite1]|uniref:Uncharacterized protein n=1 Tax=Vibrio phage Aphrodite1 TaxID=2070057 RepID=A0A2I7QHT0_9CAUD|nr:hypothetical protein FDJ25_gp182 [Vibrio phage Aphrodite1]AUR80955.1 hypothetical protein Aphrodite1_0018 [Vibrio phage Aphrodite1]